MKEAEMIISGTLLSEGQSLTVRVALQNFAAFLDENGLGEDGDKLTAAYLARITELNTLIAKTAR